MCRGQEAWVPAAEPAAAPAAQPASQRGQQLVLVAPADAVEAYAVTHL